MSTEHDERPVLAADANLTVAAAAAAAGTSRDTIKRKLAADKYPGAHPRTGDARGTPAIPVTDLVAAGHLPASVLADPVGFATEARESKRVEELTARTARCASAMPRSPPKWAASSRSATGCAPSS